MQSSEESDGDEDEGLIIVNPLQWRSERVTTMFHQLDEQIQENKSGQAKRQRRRRVIGIAASTRQQPSGLPKWAIAN